MNIIYTDLKDGYVYSAQITPYGKYVSADIILQSEDMFDPKIKLWRTAIHKKFGGFFSDSPREIDWQRAYKWVETQLYLIEKYGTAIACSPGWLQEKRIIEYHKNLNNQ